MQLTATHCNTLQHTATHWASSGLGFYSFAPSQRQHTRQHTATHCTTLQHTATWLELFLVSICHYTQGNSLQHTEQYCNALQHAATYCNIAWARCLLSHTCRYTNSNTLQHTAIQYFLPRPVTIQKGSCLLFLFSSSCDSLLSIYIYVCMYMCTYLDAHACV